MMTPLYAGILGLLFIKISFDTINARRSLGIALGPGQNNEIVHLVSAHSNFSAYAPFFILLLFFAESIGHYPAILIHVIGSCFIFGRILHYLTMKNGEKTFKQRKLGMIFTLTPIITLSVLCMLIPYFRFG